MKRSYPLDTLILVHKEQIKLLFAAIPFSLLASLVNATLLTSILWSILPRHELIIWYLILATISLARFIHYKFFNAFFEASDRPLTFWENGFLTGSVLASLAWAIIPIFLLPTDIASQAVIAFVLGGMSAGATTSLSFRLRPIQLFLAIVLIPLIFKLLSSPIYTLNAMGIMAIFFLAMLLITSKRLYKNTEQNILLRMKSDRRENELQKNINALQEFHSITSSASFSFDEKIKKLLTLGLETFQLDIGIISHINHGVYIVKYIVGPEGCPDVGTKFNFDDTYCTQTFLSDFPRGFHHVAKSEIATHPCYQTFKLEAYIGAPIWVSNSRYGTLNFSSPAPRQDPFSEHELTLIQLFAQWIGNEMARTDSEKKLSQFKTTLDMTKDCVFMFEPSRLRFIYVNQGAIDQVGYSNKELMTMTPVDIKPEFDNVQFRKMIEPLKNGTQPFTHFETIHQHKNGSLIPVEISLQYVTPPDTSPRFVALVRDITERRRIDQMKNEFVSTVSHELRTPLTSIRGALGLIVSGAVGEPPEKMKSMLDIANNNTQRLLLLINDILDLQKIESGNLDFRFASIEVMPFIKQAIEDNTGYAQEHAVSLELVESIDKGYVFADKTRLMQVMNNLISNAAKFSPDGEQIEISVSHIADYIRIAVTDHGPGIPEEFYPELFDRFTQYDSSDTRQSGGTGLGLSISKLIVEKHNGHIDFVSTPGKGSSFYFELLEQHPTQR